MDHRPRILIDCTHTLASGLRTGVQRVVRRVIEEGLLTNANGDRQIVPVVRRGRWLVEATEDQLSSQLAWAASTDAAFRLDITSQMPTTIERTLQRICALTGSRKLRKWLLPAPGRYGIYKWPLRNFHACNIVVPVNAIRWRRDDWLLLPDAYWSMPEIWPIARMARRCGVKVAAIVYDLIPITHRELYPAASVKSFERYVLSVASHSDLVLTISQTVAQEYRKYLSQTKPNLPKAIVKPFRLGAEFSNATGAIRNELQASFIEEEKLPNYLMVGSIEVRKNHKLALEAMEVVWKRWPDAKLTIAGAIGFRGDEFLEVARRHPKFGRQFQIWHDLNDAEIQYAYKACSAVLFPSIAEGFGLPIVEALYFGKPVIASDTAIHREVGGDLCEYFPQGAAAAMADQMLGAFKDASLQGDNADPQVADLVLPWSRATQLMLEAIE